MAIKDDELRVVRLGKVDVLLFENLISLFGAVFEMGEVQAAPESYLTSLLENDSFIVYAAILNNDVVGGLTGYVMPTYYMPSKEVYIYDIAVHTGFQRMGVGKKLLTALKEYCVLNSVNAMFVEAHEEDEHALDFYRSTGGEEEKVRHFNYSFDAGLKK